MDGRVRSLIGMLLIGSAFVVDVGCGKRDRDRVQTYPTHGSITFAGKPIAGAFLTLHPRGQAHATAPRATAHVQDDGTFRLSTYETGDGAPAGEYVMTVQWHKLVRANGEYSPGPNLLPTKYSSPETSDIVLKISEAPTELPVVDLKRSSK